MQVFNLDVQYSRAVVKFMTLVNIACYISMILTSFDYPQTLIIKASFVL